MSDIILLPGIGDSGPAHWQSHWQAENPAMTRFQPSDWDRPLLPDWIAALNRAVADTQAAPLLVAHSLACLLVAHWAAQNTAPIRGAFLVAVPNPQGPDFPCEAAGFSNPPETKLPFPTLVIASDNDPYGSPVYAAMRARQWSAAFVSVGALGHINGAGNLGRWPQGAALFAAFAAGHR